MATVADEILVNILINKARAEADVRSWDRNFGQSMANTERNVKRAEASIRSSTGAIGGHLRTMASALAAGFTADQVGKLADKYTQLQNRLKIAGLEGQALAQVQDRLFDSANRNGTAINGLGELYARMALSQKELGASSEQITQVTDGVAAALRVQGISATAAAGPLLQLAQAMGGGIVRAEEFNSMIEGMPVLLQVATKHIEGTGGSVSGLRNKMLEGEITSKEFFAALLKGLPELQMMAENATLTLGQSFTVLQNEMLRYIGQQDAALGVTEKISGAIIALSQNLDKIVPALTVIAAIMGGRFLAGMTASIAATVTEAAAFHRMGGAAAAAATQVNFASVANGRFATTAEIAAARAAFAAGQMTKMQLAGKTAGSVLTKAGSGIVGVFGGPVGLAVTGVSLALAGLAAEAIDSAQDIDSLNAQIEASDDLISKFQPKADTAQGSVADIGNEALAAVPKIEAFAGKVGEAAQQLWELARAKQAASLAELETQRTNLSQSVSNVQNNLPENIGARLQNRNVNSLKDVFEPVGARIVQIAKDAWTGGQFTTNNRNRASEGIAGLRRLDAEIERVRSAPVDQFVPDLETGGGGGAGAKKSGGKGKDGAAEARRLAREQEREQREALQRQRNQEDDMYRLGDAMISAMMERQLTAEDRLELEMEALKRDRDANLRMIDREVIDGNKTAAEAETLKELEEAVYLERQANLDREGKQAIRQEQIEAEQALLDINQQMLELAAGSARSAAESRRIQLQLLDLQQKRLRDELEERIKNDPKLDGDAMRKALGELEEAQRQNVLRQTMGPLEKWRDEANKTADEVREAYEEVAVRGLDSLADGFADFITGAKSAKDVFKDFASSVLADIARIEARKLVASMFGGGGGGGGIISGLMNVLNPNAPKYAGGGLISGSGTGTSDSIPIRASDGEFMVNAAATKAFLPLLQAINSGKLKGYRNGGLIGGIGGAGALPSGLGGTLQQNFYVDAKGAILADELMGEMQQMGAAQAAQAGYTAVAYTQSKAEQSGRRNGRRFM